MMTSRAMFSVFVKGFGLWLFVRGMQNFISALWYWRFKEYGFDLIGEYLIRATPQVLFGLFFVAKTNWVCKVCGVKADSE